MPFSHDMPRRWTLYRMLAVVVIGAIVCGMIVYVLSPPGPLKFDTATWSDTSLGPKKLGEARWRMHEDLLANHLRVGMSRAEVARLLGPPTRWDNVHEGFSEYDLGPNHSLFPIDDDWLVINFDNKGVVSDVVIRPD